jgi:hypothetical protein
MGWEDESAGLKLRLFDEGFLWSLWEGREYEKYEYGFGLFLF